MEFSLSYSALNNIVEMELERNPGKYKKKKNEKMPYHLSHGREKTNEELFKKMECLGLSFTRESLKELCNNFLSAEEMTKWLIDKHGLVLADDSDSDWLWICLTVLWERLFPEIPHFELIDTKMQQGYKKIENNERIEGLNLWSDTWTAIMQIAVKESLDTVHDFDWRCTPPRKPVAL